MSSYFLTDSHAHIHSDEYGRNVEDIIKTAYENKVYRVITIGVDYDDSVKAVETSEQYDFIYSSAGLHPEYADKYSSSDYDKFYKLAENKKVAGIGETGLDYYFDEHPDKSKQKEVFNAMIDIAISLNKPVIIHSRSASMDVLEELSKKYVTGMKGIFHCFDGSEEVIEWIKDKEFYLSYSGNVTFKSAENIREALRKTPLNKVLIETDSPYLSPVPLRGKPNMPANIVYTAEYSAKIKGMELNEFSNIIEENFTRLFGSLGRYNG